MERNNVQALLQLYTVLICCKQAMPLECAQCEFCAILDFAFNHNKYVLTVVTCDTQRIVHIDVGIHS